MPKYPSLDNKKDNPRKTNSGTTFRIYQAWEMKRVLSLIPAQVTHILLLNKCIHLQREKHGTIWRKSSGGHDLYNNVNNPVLNSVYKSIHFLIYFLKSAIHLFIGSFMHLPNMHWTIFRWWVQFLGQIQKSKELGRETFCFVFWFWHKHVVWAAPGFEGLKFM